MTQWKRSCTVAAASALAIAAIPGAILTIQPTGVANADVCVGGGRRVQVSGCANIADAVAPYVPPPAYYAPMPYDTHPTAAERHRVRELQRQMGQRRRVQLGRLLRSRMRRTN